MIVVLGFEDGDGVDIFVDDNGRGVVFESSFEANKAQASHFAGLVFCEWELC